MVSNSKPYVLDMETVRSQYGNRTFLIWKPYGFDMETIKSIYLNA